MNAVMETAATTKPPLKERLQNLFVEFGTLGICIYLSIFVLVWAGFATAIHLGLSDSSAYGTAGTLGAAYVATKLTQPLRILATVALTPALSVLMKRIRDTAVGVGKVDG